MVGNKSEGLLQACISSIKLYNRFRVCLPLSLSDAVKLVWLRVQFGKKHARVSFSKTSKAFLKNSRMHIFPKLHEKSYYLTIRQRGRVVYEQIVDEGETRVDYLLIDNEGELSNCLSTNHHIKYKLGCINKI